MADAGKRRRGRAPRTGWRRCLARLADRSPVRVSRDVLALSFQGSRSDLDVAIALRLQAAVVLIFLAARSVHLGQAGIDLALAGHWYTREGLAVGLGAACLVESTVFATVTL